MDTFHPLTLKQYLGTLTVVWVVPLLERKLTPRPRFLDSTMQEYLELDNRPTGFPA
jgi:hypothetical protein